MFQIPRFIIWDLFLGVLITCSSDQDSGVDDQTAEIFERLFEAWNGTGVWPQVGTQILGEIGEREFLSWLGAVQGGIDVEGAVGVEGAFVSVDLPVFEGLFAA